VPLGAGTLGKPIRTKPALDAGSGGLKTVRGAYFFIWRRYEEILSIQPIVTLPPPRCAVKDHYGLFEFSK
jgi:hypothetical protein